MQSFGKVLKYIGSVKFTVLCFILLFILVTGGTFYQVNSGLLAAQERFFGSWGILLFNFLPFPGLKTIALFLSLNLGISAFKNFSFTLRKAGMVLIHLGTIILFLGTGISSFFVKDSVVTLYEGDRTSHSYDFDKWEFVVSKRLLVQQNQSLIRSDTIDISKLKAGRKISLPNTEVTMTVLRVYPNCTGLGYSQDRIDSLQPLPLSYDQAGNIPGIIATIEKSNGSAIDNSKVLLFGGTTIPNICTLDGDSLFITLKTHEHKLPFEIQLTRFEKENHPGTTNAKSFRSYLHVVGTDLNRDVVISMNRPFRYKSLAFYQSGFSESNNVNGTSLFVVENSVRFVPYLSGFIILAGLFVNFIGMFIKSYKSLQNKATGN
jgi:hypothetical protein